MKSKYLLLESDWSSPSLIPPAPANRSTNVTGVLFCMYSFFWDIYHNLGAKIAKRNEKSIFFDERNSAIKMTFGLLVLKFSELSAVALRKKWQVRRGEFKGERNLLCPLSFIAKTN